MTTAQTAFENGNKTITVIVTAGEHWTAGDKSRVYYEISHDNKRAPIHSFYEVISGGTRDHSVEVGGRTFGYGFDADSRKKREAIHDGVRDLVEQIVNP